MVYGIDYANIYVKSNERYEEKKKNNILTVKNVMCLTDDDGKEM